MKKLRSFAGVIVCIVSLMLAAACGSTTTIKTNKGTLEVSESGNEVSFNSEDGETKIKSSNDNKDVVIETKDADGKSVSTQFSESNDVPEELPAHIPIPDNAKISSSIKSESDGTNTVMVMYNVEIAADALQKLYSDYIKDKGYSDTFDMSSEEFVMVSGNLEEGSLAVAAAPNSDNSKTFDVTLTWTDSAAK